MQTRMLEKIISEAAKRKLRTRKDLLALKKEIAGSFKMPPPGNTDLMETYRRMVKRGRIEPDPVLKSLLKKRAVRTLSGVAVVAVLTKPYECPGKCAYCPTEKGMPKSYLSDEPAVMRAVLCGFHPYRQVKARLRVLEKNGHATDKVELIVMGGTFTHFPRQYQTWFIKQCFAALNGHRPETAVKKTLGQLHRANEKARHRCVGLTLETRPDCIDPEEIRRMRRLGCTRVELGIQAIDDEVLEKNKRGHDVETAKRATRLLKDAGFKILYHMMPVLPGSTPAKDRKMFEALFSGPDFQPDMLKVYPCVVTKGSDLFRWWKKGLYKPYSDAVLLRLLVDIKSEIPAYVRIARLVRDIPSPDILAGNLVSNLRETVVEKMEAEGKKCRCMRCREIRGQEYSPEDVKMVKITYKASGGTEYFLSFEDACQDKLLAFLRLRLPSADFAIIPELKNTALVREVHSYGKAVPIKAKGRDTAQHKGFGKRLLAEAERIAKKEGFSEMAVISGIGAREYYRKLGYSLSGTYMVKNL